MLASLGFLVQESFHQLFRLGDKDIGPAIRHLDEVRAEVPIFFEILVLGIGFAEIRARRGLDGAGGRQPGGWPARQPPRPILRSAASRTSTTEGDIGFDPAGLKPTDRAEFAEMATGGGGGGRAARDDRGRAQPVLQEGHEGGGGGWADGW